jgi:hypothetical protein
MLRESLSQTNDLSTYCYLTDGGHFENTALYSLVERGCRYIVLADNAADPKPCFADLGNAIRRCRIDFQTEIQLDITPFIKELKEARFATEHYAVGRIIYSGERVKALGWSDTSLEARTGVIVYIRPTILKNDNDLPADVRQYKLENEGFPQQTTVDQWFDEAQFESYRQLGYHCAMAAFGKIGFIEGMEVYNRALEKLRKKEPLESEEQVILDAQGASERVRSGQFMPGDIESLFEFFYTYRPIDK